MPRSAKPNCQAMPFSVLFFDTECSKPIHDLCRPGEFFARVGGGDANNAHPSSARRLDAGRRILHSHTAIHRQTQPRRAQEVWIGRRLALLHIIGGQSG